MTEEVFIMSQERVKRPGHTRWYISSLLSGIIILNYFDRVAISVAAPAIQDSFHLTATELGIVFSIYTYSYTLMAACRKFAGPFWGRMGHEGWNDNMELFNDPSCFFARKIAVVSVPVSHWADERLCVPCCL